MRSTLSTYRTGLPSLANSAMPCTRSASPPRWTTKQWRSTPLVRLHARSVHARTVVQGGHGEQQEQRPSLSLPVAHVQPLTIQTGGLLCTAPLADLFLPVCRLEQPLRDDRVLTPLFRRAAAVTSHIRMPLPCSGTAGPSRHGMCALL
jgi:hypothetical protein